MNVGIIGCGIIGNKRAASLGNNKLVAVADHNIKNAFNLALKYKDVKVFSDYKELLKEDIDIVIVATTNHVLSPIALDAINAGKHVLIEKPGAISYKEFDSLILAAKEKDVKVKIGYNKRYHLAISKAISMCKDGVLGELMFIRGRYGHGGRKGYDREWRADKSLSGGGELMDQGVHLIDLSMALLGDLSVVSGSTKTYFWDMNVDDNAFLNLVNKEGKTAWLHVSCTEWKNTFSFEIYGKKGKLQIDGLGGSYGTEKLTYYKMSTEMGIPEVFVWEYHKPDESFKNEFIDFVHKIKHDLKPQSDLENSQKVLKIVDEIYNIRN